MHYIFIYFIPHHIDSHQLHEHKYSYFMSPAQRDSRPPQKPTSPASHAVPCLIAELNNMLSWVSGLLSIIENE